ncbi:MAG: hypothetical protein JO002_15835 [Burkholderiaceae bacterium]|nr:hypothetical protein [Burkholderiaceae bacterium]
MELTDFDGNIEAHILRAIGRRLGPEDKGQQLSQLSELHVREVDAIGKTFSLAAVAYLKVITDAGLLDIKRYLVERGFHFSAD